jgi:diguanylate cyclase (GGDEF)-like protein/PAS domain S-box-containing protein
MHSGMPYRLFLEGAPDAFFAHDIDGRFVDVNLRACDSLGYTRDELLRLTVMDVDPGIDPQQIRSVWQTLVPGQSHLLQSRHRRKDGSEFPVEVHIGAAQLDGGMVLFGMARDITERIEAEHCQQRLTQLYRARSEVNQMIVRTPQPPQLFQRVCEIAVRYGGMRMAWVGQLQPGSQRIEPVAVHGEGGDYLRELVISADASVPEGRGPSGRAWRERVHVVMNDLDSNPAHDHWRVQREAFGWKSSAAFAIECSGATVAVLNVYHTDAQAFDAEIIGLLDEMVIDIGFALDNIEREALREQAQRTIREQNLFLQAIFDSEPECVKIVALDGCLLQMNRAGLAMLEADSVEQVNAVGLLSFIDPDYCDAFIEFHRYICAGNSGHLEFRIRGRAGSERWLETHGTPLRDDDGRILANLAVTRDITDKKRYDQLIWQKANFDQLTALPNRNMFQDRLRHELKLAQRNDAKLAVLFIDLDHFKEVNDTLGHQVGDTLLIEVAQRISSCLRESDMVARLGGDEFMVLLPGFADVAAVGQVAEKIIQRLSVPLLLGDPPCESHVSASIGISVYPDDGEDADQLMRNVDQAMYVAKAQGRNDYAWFTPVLRERTEHRHGLLQDLRLALAKQQLSLCFQPIVEMDSGRIAKVEALLRWNHPTRGMVSPADFIPLAEESGLILEIGYWVMSESLRWMRQWVGAGATDLQVGINVSPVQMQRQYDQLDQLYSDVRAAGLEPRHLAIEITEGLLLQNSRSVQQVIDSLREHGVRLAIDDFGTGYSALSYLKQFDIDYLKIDRSFVRDLESDPGDRALCEAIIVMAHKLGLQVIAEGVETVEQCELLRAAGCDYAQGYYFARPLPPEEIGALLQLTIQPPSAP